MRPIDADKLKEHIDKLPALPDGNFAGNHSALKALINMQPTIEPFAQPEQTKMIEEIRKWINSGNRGSVDYFIVDKIEEIINKYE